ncbi:hypothetical protein [Okeania sp. SIO2B3]|uniref:hypothetical protein n=1 Tax=Okeania sp. SIO2B3 TaxID=2607784 RepID=UPI0013BFBC42|nr:hypothetical protein [Okeania sp. SIO2B3]NET44867.1 hypothetical protein [Okeania sp. SIO2B3]
MKDPQETSLAKVGEQTFIRFDFILCSANVVRLIPLKEIASVSMQEKNPGSQDDDHEFISIFFCKSDYINYLIFDDELDDVEAEAISSAYRTEEIGVSFSLKSRCGQALKQIFFGNKIKLLK